MLQYNARYSCKSSKTRKIPTCPFMLEDRGFMASHVSAKEEFEENIFSLDTRSIVKVMLDNSILLF